MRLASGNVKKISLELGGRANIVFADADLEIRPQSRTRSSTARARIAARGPDPRRAIRPRPLVELLETPAGVVEVGLPSDRRPRSEPWSASSSGIASATTSRSGSARGRRSWSVVRPRPTRRWPAARTSCRRCSMACRTTCESRARRSSDRSSRSSRLTRRRRRSASPTPPRTGCPARSGAAISARPCARPRRSRPASSASTPDSSVHTEAPFSGYKMSGIGRELGMAALDLYTETKNVFIDLS